MTDPQALMTEPSSASGVRQHRMSAGQRALWLLHELDPSNPAYNVHVAARICSPLDVAALRRAFQRISDRHAPLRSTFRWVAGEPVQCVAESPPVRFEVHPEPNASDEDLTRRLTAIASEPFDLERGPVFRITLLARAPDDHWLVIHAHHIAIDMWSCFLLVEEMASLYEAECAGVTLELPVLRYEFADYVRWQERMLSSAEGERHWEFWRETLKGDLPPLELPCDRPRPRLESHAGATHRMPLDPKFTRRLTSLAKAEKVTSFTLLLACFQAFLQRITGQSEIVIGAPMAGRTRPEFESVVGYFVNPVVFRVDLGDDPSFRDLLQRARASVLDAMEHQDFPFTLLVERLAPPRDPTRSPVFQAMLSFEHSARSEATESSAFLLGEEGRQRRIGGLDYEPLALPTHGSQFDFTLGVQESGDGLTLTFEYNTDLFEPATIETLARRFRVLLDGILETPSGRVSSLPLFLGDERRVILENWCGGHFAPPSTSVMEQVTRARPDAVAFEVGEAAVPYATLTEAAQRLARELKARGITRSAIVGVAADDPALATAAMLAIWSMGAIYLPLDPELPHRRLALVLEDADPAAVLVAPGIRDRLPSTTASILDLSLSSDPAENGAPLAFASPRAEEAAYLIYTSGTTGAPKGVVISHGALANHAAAIARRYALSARDRVLQFASPAFDVSLEEIVPTLAVGGVIVARPPGPPPAIPELERLLADRKITVANLPSSYWHEWADGLREHEPLPPALRLIVVGSERVRPSALERWRAIVGDRVRLLHAYGVTEATITATVDEPAIEVDVARDAVQAPIGRPLEGVRVYVLDRNRAPVPPGVPGELAIGGSGVGLGYRNQPEHTAERFLEDPFAAAPGRRLYLTGDRARWRADGRLELIGRKDGQVKLLGHRVEPEEIEAILRHHEGLHDVVVIAVDGPRGPRLVAYYAANQGKVAPTAESLREFAAERLPHFMLPAAFVPLDAVPRTPGGKLDRAALPPPPKMEEEGPRGSRPPRSTAEKIIAEIWRSLLGRSRVGLDENFFALGGDSILSIQVVSRARQKGLHLTARQFFERPTIAGLAATAEAGGHAAAEQGPVTGEAPLTPIQRWLLEQTSPEPHHDNQAVLLTFDEPLDCVALEGALEALLLHHDALRLRWSGGSTQFFAPPGGPMPLTRIDVTSIPDAELAGALEREGAALQASLDLAAGPVVRGAWFDAGPHRPARLLLAAHHLTVDGVSWRILLDDLASAYQSLRRGRSPELPPKTSSFMTWAQRLTHHAKSGAMDAEAPFWTEACAPASAPLPIDRHAVSAEDVAHVNRESGARSVTVELDRAATRRFLRARAGSEATRVDAVLLAALARALATDGCAGPWRVDLEGHGRNDLLAGIDLSRTVGWFTALFPIRLDPGPRGVGAGFMVTLDLVRRALQSLPSHGIGYGVLRWLRGDAELTTRLAAAPPAAICFNYLGQFDRALPEGAPFKLAAEPLGICRSPHAVRPHLLDVNAIIVDERLRVEWTYGAALHHRATIERLAARFRSELETFLDAAPAPAAAASPSSSLGVSAEVDDVHPLTPMQHGMLFHTLGEAQAGTYVEQLTWRFEGELDEAALDRAWQALIDRHEVLRASIAWDGADRPVQVIHRHVHAPIDRLEWDDSPEEEQERLEAFLRSGRESSFDLAHAPLMRAWLIRLAPRRHQFVWTHHHLLLDGWSVPLLLEDLARLYRSFAEGREPDLRPVPSYRDYLEWLERQDLGAAETYWKRSLEGLRAATSLPMPAPDAGTDLRPDDALDDVYSEHREQLSTAATAALETFARRHALTLGTVVRGAWAILVSRYAGEEDVVFGSVVSGRPAELPGADQAVGLFINTLPLRVRVSNDAPLGAWLQELQRLQFEMLRFEQTPLVQIQAWSPLPRGPLFQNILVFENYPLRKEALSTLDAIGARELRAWDKTHYALTLAVSPGDHLSLHVVYDHRRFAADAIRRMVEHLRTLLESMPGDPGRTLTDLDMLPAVEQRRVLGESAEATPHARRAYPERTIHELLAEQAACRPDAIAIQCESRTLTYAQLTRQSQLIADRLRALGVLPGDRVAICMERSLGVVTAMLGVLESGAAYVPLDPSYPPRRLAFLLDDCGAAALITTRRLLPGLSARVERTIVMDDLAPLATDPERVEATRPAGSPSSPDDLAYVMYTSGSTGEPKGIEVTHRGIVRLVRDTDWIQLREDDVVLQVVSLSFDPSALEIWGCLLNGGRLVLHPSRTPALHEIGEALIAHRATTVVLITGLFPLMVEERLDDLAGLRRLIVGGDAMPPEPARRVLEAHPGLELINAYGPTEGTVVACAHTMTQADQVGTTVPIGRPISHTRVLVLDRERRPAPIGIPGEIWIGGDGVARGYHRRPELTAERFVPDPFDPAGGRLYRTGDLGRRRADGAIEFLGRVDEQLKIRGFRVEPGEIEVALGGHPDVRECAVVARSDPRGERRLVAYVGSGVVPLPVARLSEFLRATLPEYMIPSAFVVLERFPLTPNGKVDRAALPDPGATGDRTLAPRVAPRTALELQVAQVWSEVLHVADPGIDDDFFESGGHSLLATQLLARLRSRCACRLTLRALYDHASIRGLAEWIAAQERDLAPASLATVPPQANTPS